MTKILETTSYRAPLALRVIDAATSAAVADGLVATAWQVGDPTSARTARRSPVSALLGFTTLPGLRSQEYAVSSGGAQPTWPPPSTEPFMISVVDTLGRYLPEVFAATAPRNGPVAVTLYSAPERNRPPGWATASGEVAVSGGTAPAGWAFVQLSDGASTYQTISDAAGRFLQYLPYPEALPPLAGSPPIGSGIGDVSWPLTCIVHYTPAALQWPVNPSPSGPPDISSIRSQAVAQIVTSTGQHPSVVVTLRFGTPLRLPLSVVPS